ncbi:MAG: tRNA pseudouridine(38-40) synthase TruA [Lachnospiraceae bacterium]|nr:tRNA pseudouridine(38-40) synthase TruA [Lachnospiraceae bacterium]
MQRVRLIIAYDGTNYCGWQIQDNGITIEEVINKALTALCNEEIAVIGASRTDSGVHAMGNVAVFDTNSRIPAEKFSYALNQRLPDDIRIQRSDEVASDWHPRYQDTIKTYEYRYLNRRFPDPIRRLYTYFVYYPMDVVKMQEAANYLIGEHDFKSFCSTKGQQLTTIREIYDLTVKRQGDEIILRVTGNGFLYNMVRIIAGTLARVGTGLYEPGRVKDILEATDRQIAGPKAPASGLTLIGIKYPNDK